MNTTIVHEIALAISDLEEAISVARSAAGADGAPSRSGLVERLDVYHAIVQKQWKLLSKLCFYLTVGNVVQAAQSAKLINGLSGMIRDDAEELVCQETSPRAILRSEFMVC